jgi:hypothetical protein
MRKFVQNQPIIVHIGFLNVLSAYFIFLVIGLGNSIDQLWIGVLIGFISCIFTFLIEFLLIKDVLKMKKEYILQIPGVFLLLVALYMYILKIFDKNIIYLYQSLMAWMSYLITMFLVCLVIFIINNDLNISINELFSKYVCSKESNDKI